MTFSFPAADTRSTSAERLSNVQTDTRLLVTLCVADWTRHGPTWNVGVKDGGGSAPGLVEPDAEVDGPGVDERLPEPRA